MPVILSSLRSMTGSIVREWRLERPMRFTGLILVLVVLWISIRLLSMMEFSVTWIWIHFQLCNLS